jgi:hypothetical protein
MHIFVLADPSCHNSKSYTLAANADLAEIGSDSPELLKCVFKWGAGLGQGK